MSNRTRGRQRRIEMSIAPLKALAHKVLQRLGQPEAELGLLLVNDRQIRRLNKKYRGIDSPTDVLSFPLSLDSKAVKGRQTPPPLLGDVVISLETARRQVLDRSVRPKVAGAQRRVIRCLHRVTHLCQGQAREKHRALYQEVGRLLIHGTLHLLGFDHEEARDARRMRRKERELAKELLETR